MVTRKKKIFFFPDFHCSIFILIGTYRIATYVNAVLCDFLTASNAQRSFKKLCCCCSCWRGIKESKYVSMEQKILANEIRFKANKKCLQKFFFQIEQNMLQKEQKMFVNENCFKSSRKPWVQSDKSIFTAICGHVQPSMALSHL